MKLRHPGAIFCALAIAAAGVLAASAPAQTTQVSAAAPKLPYTTDPIAEIAKLKPAPNAPATVDDLKAVQARAQAVARFALPAIVNIEVSDGQGSGVIVSPDGFVLTAGHVSGTPHTAIRFRLSNGTLVSGEALGANNQVDSGMCKITTPGTYAYMPMGSTSKMTTGQWVIAMGHPGGWETGRDPVVRLGKVLTIHRPSLRDHDPQWYVRTDCPLIMGDSGGPVFDLDGRVIAINSRIGMDSTSNVHVPIDTFEETWERLAKGDEWGAQGVLAKLGSGASGADVTPQIAKAEATLSLNGDTAPDGVKINQVRAGKASEKAGIQLDDVITKFNGQAIKTREDLVADLAKYLPGDTVTLDVVRNSKTLQVKVVLDAK